MHDLLALAERLGVAVVTARMPDGMLGCYVPARRAIRLDDRLTPVELRSVLAHELGHVFHGDAERGHPSPAEEARWERRADAFAARLLIDPRDYARAERVGSDAESIAEELGVTVDLVEAYRRDCLTRVRGGVYAQTRVAVPGGAGGRAFASSSRAVASVRRE